MLTLTDLFTKGAREYLIELDKTNNEYLRHEIYKLLTKRQHDPLEPQLGIDIDQLIKEIKKANI
jgi:hypothetical protein